MTYGWIILHVDVFFSQRTKPPLSSGIFHGQRVHLPAWWKIEPPASWTTARNQRVATPAVWCGTPGVGRPALFEDGNDDMLGGLTTMFWGEKHGFCGNNIGILYVFMEYITNNVWFGCAWKWGFDCLVQSGVLSACVDCWKFVQQFLF